jgi:phenolic acid decarboxylase
LVVLRLVFMNRWVQQKQHSGKTYLTDFLDLLEEAVKSQ